MGKMSEDDKQRERKKHKRKEKRHMKRKYSSSSPPSSPSSARLLKGKYSSSSSSSSSSAQLLKVSTKDEISKKKERFKVPYELVCKGCDCIVAQGVKVNAIKKLVGKIWSYKFKCPLCRNKIVMERASGKAHYIEVEGAKFDWNAWKKKRSKEYLDTIDPSLSDRYNIFDILDFSVWEDDPRTGKSAACMSVYKGNGNGNGGEYEVRKEGNGIV